MVTPRASNFLHITACNKRIGTALPTPTERRTRFPENFFVAKRRGQSYA
nr:MAG TPA: hypothetical protein [Bacteriophage sp.]